MTGRMQGINWTAVAFVTQLVIMMGAQVWVASAAFTKLDALILKVGEMEKIAYTKESARADLASQQAFMNGLDIRLRVIEERFKELRK